MNKTLERELAQLRERLSRTIAEMSRWHNPTNAAQLVAAESWLRTRIGEVEREIAQGGRDADR